MFVELIILSKTRQTDNLYTYRVPESMKNLVERGMRVLIPFGRGNRASIGIVLRMMASPPEGIAVKDIIDVLDRRPILSEELLQVAGFMITHYLSDYSSALQTVLPPGDMTSISEFYQTSGNSPENQYDALFEFLVESKSYEAINEVFGHQYTKSKLWELVASGYLTSSYDVLGKHRVKYERYITLVSSDHEIPERAVKQRALVDYLVFGQPTLASQAMADTGVSSAIVKALTDKGIVSISQKRVYRDVLPERQSYVKVQMNDEQQKAFDAIQKNPKGFYLLKGVTGSGKTEAYLQLAEKVLEQGKDAIVLVPEIALTPQTIKRFAGRFGQKVAVMHSRLSVSERFDQWKLMESGQVHLVVGARSAIFAPFKNLGLIIIDEAHELSYFSEKHPKYSAIEIAEQRASITGSSLVLGSATPSIDEMYAAQSGRYELLTLNKRATSQPLPRIDIVDMREELKSENYSVFSRLLMERLAQTLDRREQAILFLNKRGYNSYVFCRNCGYIHRCDSCDVSMTYHKHQEFLVCHYCGRTARKPKRCPQCASDAIKEFGAGTQKVEEEVRLLFPEARVLRMDADTTKQKKDYETIYEKMVSGEADILVGTQMLAKGLDFEHVTLVGIVAADISLNMPDFRANERTYQLITQVAGRAGRGTQEGSVVLQTYLPEHFAIQTATQNDYAGFYEKEMVIRQKFRYPPFVDLINIRIAHGKRQVAFETGRQIVYELRERLLEVDLDDCEIIGPVPGVIERINNAFRFNVLLKTQFHLGSIRRLINQGIDVKSYYNKGISISITVNPVQLN